MKLRSLRAYSALFVDFVEDVPSARAFLPMRPTRENLISGARRARNASRSRREVCSLIKKRASELNAGERVLESVRLLNEQDAVPVSTSLPPDPVGGPLCLVLRCLTTVKLAAELGENGLPSVPLAWIQPDNGGFTSRRPLALLNEDFKLSRVFPGESASFEGVLQQIVGLAPAKSDAEVLEGLKNSYQKGADSRTTSRQFLAWLMNEWGLVILDAADPDLHSLASDALEKAANNSQKTSAMLRAGTERLEEAGYASQQGSGSWNTVQNFVEACMMQDSILPAATIVAGSSDLHAVSLALPLFAELGLTPPLVWPRVSATLLDARTRKIRDRYGLSFEDFFAGAQQALHRIGLDAAVQAGSTRFTELATEIESEMRKLAGLALEDGLKAEVNSSREKMLYQIEKLHERFLSASKLRREAALRQLERACNTVAPDARPQECELSALYFLLRYSRAILRQIYDRMTVWNHEHQLIDVD